MSNATESQLTPAIGSGTVTQFSVPVDGGSTIYKGTLVAQLTSTGYAVPYSTASSGWAIGVATHDADNSGGSDGDKRVIVEARQMYAFANGAGGDAFSDVSKIGSVVYASDDHTVADNSNSQAYAPIGFFYGMESDGKVRVFVDPTLACIVKALQGLTNSPADADALRDQIVALFG
jgi:hypothetical protein